MRIRRAALLALLALFVPAGAVAAPTATLKPGATFEVTGEDADETLTIVQEGDRIAVHGPAGMNDPDGNGFFCSAHSGEKVSCLDLVVDHVVVNGGGGHDTLEDKRVSTPNPADDDTLNGGAGPDRLVAPTGSGNIRLTLNGGEGDDRLVRNRGPATSLVLLGAEGDDTLDAGTGQLGSDDHGGPGDDTYNGSPQQNDSFIGDPGADTYNGGTRTPQPGEVVDDPPLYQLFTAPDRVSYSERVVSHSVSLDGSANDGEAGEGDNVMPDVEVVHGTPADDTISAGGQSAHLVGRAGDDRVSGGDGNDTLEGNSGSDLLFGNGGDDSLEDGDGTPAVHDPMLPPAGDDRLDGGPGRDWLASDRGADELIGGSGADSAPFFRVIPRAATEPPPSLPVAFEISLDDLANDGHRGGGEGDNVHSDIEWLFTGRGDDVLTGSAGADAFDSGDGNDRIEPGAGSDTVLAGQGDDSVSALDQTTDRVDCQQGSDHVVADLPGTQPERADVTLDCEIVTGVPFGGAADTTAPRIEGLRATNGRFAVGRRNTAQGAKKRGTTFTFRLSEDARVTIAIARKLPGRRVRGRCRAPRGRSGRRCTRLVNAATLVRANSRTGSNRVAYSGRIRGRALRPGRYLASARAIDRAGNRSAPRTVALTVVP